MRILLTNDDGVEAYGLKVLYDMACALSDDVWVCAPVIEQSGKGRGITLHEPLRARRLGDRRFAVSGTPTDCVQIAVNDLMPSPPDLVLSGVNRGFNLAQDVTLSGTVAGALIERLGYVEFYVLTTVVALPGILMFWLMLRAGLVDTSAGTASTATRGAAD